MAELEFGGVKVKGKGKIIPLIIGLSTFVGFLYGGFDVLNCIGVIGFKDDHAIRWYVDGGQGCDELNRFEIND